MKEEWALALPGTNYCVTLDKSLDQYEAQLPPLQSECAGLKQFSKFPLSCIYSNLKCM